VTKPGETLAVELFWVPLRRSEADLTVFVHLLGPPRADGSPLWAQDDHPPQRGRANTTIWRVGQILRDVYQLTIPPDTPAGIYHLTVGLYDPVSGQRVPIAQPGAAQPEPDGVLVVTLTVVEP
jgi:hypothetical protein